MNRIGLRVDAIPMGLNLGQSAILRISPLESEDIVQTGRTSLAASKVVRASFHVPLSHFVVDLRSWITRSLSNMGLSFGQRQIGVTHLPLG
jgi:hypothetical protein